MGSISENKWLSARVADAVALCDRQSCPHFVGFLDEGQKAQITPLLQRERAVSFRFFGGFDGAERTLLGVFPPFIEPEDALFPLCVLRFSYRAQAELSHRDFLGTMLSCGIKRETIGDIVCGTGETIAVVSEEVAPFLQQQIEKVGGEGVTITTANGETLTVEKKFLPISATVASPRLDNVVKALIGSSREKAAAAIVGGLVSVNHVPCDAVAKTVSEGDILSLRGVGRFRIDALSEHTKKGRLFLSAQKYL